MVNQHQKRTARRGNRDRGPDPREVFSGRHLILRRLRPEKSRPLRSADEKFARWPWWDSVSRYIRCSASIRSISSGESTRRGVRAEKSAIPAKGDRGLSDSAMVRSYSEQLDVRHRRGRPMPLRPGAADHVQGQAGPRRGWQWWTCGNGGNSDFHEAAGSHFQAGCWKWKKPRRAVTSRSPISFPRTCRAGIDRVDIAGARRLETSLR